MKGSGRRWQRGLAWLFERAMHGRAPASRVPFALERVRRILVVRNDNIGDVLCTTPALRALRRAAPSANLTVLVSAHCRPILERNPDVDEVLAYTKAKHAADGLGRRVGAAVRLVREMKRHQFDLAISMRRSYSRSSAWLAYASGAAWRLGYAPPASEPFGFFVNLVCEPAPDLRHEVDACLALLDSIGISPAGRDLTVVPDSSAQATIRERWTASNVAASARLALVHLSSRRQDNRWPLEAFARAGDLLRERLGFTVVLSWAPGDNGNPLFPGDDGKAEQVAAQMTSPPVLLATPELSELIAAVSLSHLVVSPDGGVAHIAAALQVPQVALFGKTDQRQWAPVNPRCRVLQRGNHVAGITVEEVLAAAVAVLTADRDEEVRRGR